MQIEELPPLPHNGTPGFAGNTCPSCSRSGFSSAASHHRTTMAFTLELDHVTKAYDEFVAVDNLSFNIPEGEIFGLLGPNGAGKTSSIRMMIGITVPDSGCGASLRPAAHPPPARPRWISSRGARPLQEDEDPGEPGLPRPAQGHQRAGGHPPRPSVAGAAGTGQLGPRQGRGALQGNAAEGAVHRRRPPRARLHDSRRALQRP